KRVKTLAACSSALSLSFAAMPAIGQSVDYGLLEELFGEPVITSATGTPKRASEAPATVLIIGEEEIRRSPVTNIAALLRNYAGIEASQFGTDNFDIGIRGGNMPFNPLVLVMVDGRQVYADHLGYVNWNSIPVELDEIQQIEVIKGPAGAIFGFNAVVGVVNIITKNPLHDQGTTASVSYGNDDFFRASFSTRVKPADWVGIRLSGGFDTQDGFSPDSSDRFLLAGMPFPFIDEDQLRTGLDQARSGNVALEAIFKLADHVQLSLEGTYADSSNFGFAPVRLTAVQKNEWISVRGKLSVDSKFGLIDLVVYNNRLDQAPDFEFNGQATSVFENDVLVVQLQDSLKIGTKNTVRLQLEYRDNNLNTFPAFAGTIRFDLLAVGGLWEHKLNDLVTLTGAIRLDNVFLDQDGPITQELLFTAEDFDRTISDVTANAAVTFALTPKDTLRLLFGRGLQLPQLANLGIGQPGGQGRLLAGEPSLDPAVVYSAEVAYDRKLSVIDGEFRTSLFYRDLDNFSLGPTVPTVFPPAVPAPVGQAADVGGFEAYGAEVSVSGRQGNLRWGVNYTFTEVDEDLVGNSDDALFVPTALALDAQTARHKVNVQLGYSVGKFAADLFFRYRSETGDLGLPAVPGFPNLFPRQAFDNSIGIDARLSYFPTEGVELFFAGENLADDPFVTSTSIPGDIRARGGIRIRF
ncbi:MAG: TonB-dependent receptor plug domain-containing protein, partial [Rhodothalassiaceae bacterium]